MASICTCWESICDEHRLSASTRIRALLHCSRLFRRRVSGAMSDLKTLLERVLEHDVEFVVIGAFASAAHGATLLTQDVDICCSFTARNLLKLQDAIAELHPVHRLTPKRLPLELTRANCRGLKNLYLETDLGVIDCLSEVLGVGAYSVVKKQSVPLDLDFGKCRVLGLDALIRAKRAMNRPRDREAVVQLEAIRAKQHRDHGGARRTL